MALHLITGYAGQEHVTSADQGAYNMGTYGEGEFVLDRGNKLAATVASNNSIIIADGEAMMQGRFIKLPVGTTESVTIDNGTSGMKRRDLIVIRYSKDAGTGVESASFAVKKGTPSSGTPSDPSVTTGNITDGTDLVNEMKLYRVNIDGLNITSLDTLFSVKESMVDYMDAYQLPVASSGVLGGVKAFSKAESESQAQEYSRIYIDSNNILRLGNPTVEGDHYSGFVYELSSAINVPAGISLRLDDIELSTSASNDFREWLYDKKSPGYSSDTLIPSSMYLKQNSGDYNPSAYILWNLGIYVPRTGNCYVYSGGIVIYNPSSSSVSVRYIKIDI